MRTGTLGATATRAVSPANGYASTGGSDDGGPRWADTDLPADVDASVSVYADSLIPARIFVRGANLDTTTPTYYAATITRGVNVKLVRVVNGVETALGSIQSNQYLSGQWVRLRIDRRRRSPARRALSHRHSAVADARRQLVRQPGLRAGRARRCDRGCRQSRRRARPLRSRVRSCSTTSTRTRPVRTLDPS